MTNDARARLDAQIAKLTARRAAIEARERTRDRQRRTHAAIVVGALALESPERLGLTAAGLRTALDAAVTRPHDRRALGLPVVDDAA